MSETTQALNVAMNAELQKAINAATDPTALRAAILAEAERQATVAQEAAATQATTDAAAAAAATAAAATEAAKGYTRVENIGGRDFEFSGANEDEVNQMILNAYRIAYTVREDATPAVETVHTVDPAAEAAAVAAAAAAEATAKAELELKFKRGEITAADYIEQSGAMDAYLAAKGVPIEALKATVEQSQDSQEQQSWAEASEAFLHSVSGADWPGGEQNRNLIGLKVAELGLVDEKDKVAALAKAWTEMKRTGMVFKNETATDPAVIAATKAARVAAEAATHAAAPAAAAPAAAAPAAAAPAAAAKNPSGSSALFGASSGVGAGAGTTERAVAPTLQISKDASPAEILQAWKDQIMAQGQNPDAAFTAAFAKK
jgi:pyruvate dehydrogenase E2 component (dihydrolipoamide acetyltransferase)